MALPERPVLTPTALLVGLALAEPPAEVRRDAPGAVMPERLWDITHLDLAVKLDIEAGTVEGTATHTLAPLGRPHDRVRLHQIGLDIREVRVDGAPTGDLRIGPDWIDIRVPPGAGHEIQIDYTAKPPLGLHFRGPRHGDRNLAVWSQGEDEDNRYWFPGWDYPNDAFTMAMHITVRDGLSAWANGDAKGSEPAAEGWTTHHYALEQPITGYHVALVAGDYRSVTLDVPEGMVPLEIVGPAGFDEAWLRGAADDAVAEMTFFQTLLDEPFPYPVYRQAWVERFMYGGMENPGLTTLAVRRIRDPARPDRVANTEGLIAHELAHQWFGDLLTCYGWRELWLNEGFATYYAHLYLAEKYGPEFAAVELYDRRQAALRRKNPMAPRAHTYAKEDNSAVYVKGASVLHLLRTHLGPAVYDQAIRDYIDANRFRFVESDDLRRALEDRSGQHLGWVFDQWVHGAGMPSWKSQWAVEDDTLTVSITAGEGPVFHAPLRIEVGTSKATRTHQVWLAEGTTRLVLPLDGATVHWVAPDPDGALLGELDHQQTPGAWLVQLGKSPSPYARVAAMKRLGQEEPTEAGIAELARIAKSGAAPNYREVAIQALGELASHPDAQAALVAISRDASSVVREAALDAMTNSEGSEAFVPRLKEAQRDDPDPANRASALDALENHDEALATALARRALARRVDDVNGVEHAIALHTLAETGDLDDGLAMLRFLGVDHSRWVRTSAAFAAIGIWGSADEGKKRDRLQDRLAELLLGWLDDPDYRLRTEALQFLAKVGRDRDIDALEAYADRTPVPEHDDLVKAAVRDIRTPEPTGEDPIEGLRKRVDALADQLGDTNQRVDRLEEWRQ